MGNFRETFGNFLETVRVVIGQESVRVGMWSLPGQHGMVFCYQNRSDLLTLAVLKSVCP